jgi:hypothetical protein
VARIIISLKKIGQDSEGVGLIETIISIGLVGIIAVCFLVATGTSYKTGVLADEQVTASGLARSQMEYIVTQPYDGELDANLEASYTKLDSAEIPEGYSIFSINRSGAIVDAIVGLPWNPDPTVDAVVDSDQGMQKITLVIKYHENGSWILEGLKINAWR